MKPTIKPTPKQHLAWQRLQDNITRQVVFGGGAGGGKSHMGCEWILTNCFFYPGTRWFIGRDSLKSIRESTLVSWYKVLAHHKIKYEGLFKYNGQDNFFLFGNGSRVDLVDLGWYPSDPFYERFGSMEFTGGWIEEAGEVSDLAAQMISSRVGRMYNDKYNLLGKVLYTCNPKKNFLYKEFYQPWKKGELPPDKAFIQSLHKDNIYGESGYEGVLQRLSGVARQRLLLGDWEYDEDANSLIEYEKILDVFRNKHMNGGVHYITVDVARKGQDTTVIGVWSGFGVKLYQYSKLLTTEVTKKVKQLQEKYLISNSNIIVDEDGVGCLIPGTMVLTKKGWTKIEDISEGDLVYSKDEAGNLGLYPVTANTHREETDVIVLDTGIGFSFSHFLPIKTRKEHKFKMIGFDDCVGKKRVYTDSSFNWAGHGDSITFEDTQYMMPNGGTKKLSNGLTISAENFAEFLGWFVSEGHIEGNYIKITQNLDSRDIDEIRKVLSNCGFNYYEKLQTNKKAVDFIFRQKALYSWLKENCYEGDKANCFNKKAPDFIRTANKKVISAFLHSHNRGDGYMHHGRHMHITSSVRLAYDIQECYSKCGINANIRIKQKKGSVSKIGERSITRTTDIFIVSEIVEELTIGKVRVKEERCERVYNLEIDSPTKLYLVLFEGRTPFFVHNGGVVDQLRCTGFVNNSRPLANPENPQFNVQGTLQVENFDNLRSQCYFRLADRINKGHLFVDCEEPEIIEKIIEELEWVKQKDIDSDKKKGVIPKELIKEAIGRSPDFSDTLMMREYFELKPRFIVTAA